MMLKHVGAVQSKEKQASSETVAQEYRRNIGMSLVIQQECLCLEEECMENFKKGAMPTSVRVLTPIGQLSVFSLEGRITPPSCLTRDI